MLLFAALVAAIAWRIAAATFDAGSMVVVAASAALGYVLADAVSGTVHWIGDTFFTEDTPVIGEAFVRPFREHHRDPLAITRHGFLEVNGNNCLALLPLLVPTWALGDPSQIDGPVPWLPFQVAAVCFAIATFGTNQFHKWAHLPAPPRLVGWLQRSRLILSPLHHAGHHRAPFRRSYCVTVGWLNPALDALGAFDRAERGLRALRAMRRARPDAARDATPADTPPVARQVGLARGRR